MCRDGVAAEPHFVGHQDIGHHRRKHPQLPFPEGKCRQPGNHAGGWSAGLASKRCQRIGVRRRQVTIDLRHRGALANGRIVTDTDSQSGLTTVDSEHQRR